MDGSYGSAQGLGGLEATVNEGTGQITPVLQDYFGNVPATIDLSTGVKWASTRLSAYGPVLGYVPPTFSSSISLAQATLWRGKRIEPTGLYWLGARYYDPISGRFLSPDPLGHSASWDLYSFCNGDPVNRFDPDGRFGKGFGYALGDVMDRYSSPVQNLIDSVMNPLVGMWNPYLANKYFSGGYGGGPSYTSMYGDGSTAFGLGSIAGQAAGD